MTLLLTTAFLAATALALPTTPLVQSRGSDNPQPLGVESGQLFDQLNFTTYESQHCTGAGRVWTGSGYGLYNVAQMQSYSLTRSLNDNEVLEFFTSLGAGLQSKYSVDYGLTRYADACALYDSTAGINATTSDNKGHGRWEGCHTLENNEACANLFQTQ